MTLHLQQELVLRLCSTGIPWRCTHFARHNTDQASIASICVSLSHGASLPDSFITGCTLQYTDQNKFFSRSASKSQESFVFSKTSRPTLVPTQPPIQRAPSFFLRLNRPERQANHSLPSSPEVKNDWRYTSTPLIRLNDTYREDYLLGPVRMVAKSGY
jgi:hypothetical protein